MSEEASVKNGSEAPITWIEAWRIALTRPNLVFYESLAKDPSITNNRAYLWIIIAGFIAGIGEVARALIYNQERLPNLLAISCILVFYPLIILIAYIVIIAITHGMAKILGGKGTYSELTHIVAAFSSPIMIVTAIISLIPVLNFAGYGLAVYEIGLAILSVRAIHRIGWGWATISCVAFILPTLINIFNATQFVY